MHLALPHRCHQPLHQYRTHQAQPNPPLQPGREPSRAALRHTPHILRQPPQPSPPFPLLLQLPQAHPSRIRVLSQHCPDLAHVAFVGSGLLPLTSILLVSHHLTSTTVFHNYDIDTSANSMAVKLVESRPELREQIDFYTTDVVNVPEAALREYDVVFLVALVGVETEEKMNVIDHLGKNMAPVAILVLRSAHRLGRSCIRWSSIVISAGSLRF